MVGLVARVKGFQVEEAESTHLLYVVVVVCGFVVLRVFVFGFSLKFFVGFLTFIFVLQTKQSSLIWLK
ncbi:hypothetical protein D3C87_2073730 [compost metagenome]